MNVSKLLVLALNDKITFGKHKGKTVQEIIEENPTYIEWCINEIDGFELDDLANLKLNVSISEMLFNEPYYPAPHYSDW